VTTTDPLAALDRRVRRARRWLAAGAGAVTAAVVAAVVVPLAVLGGNGSPNSVGITHHAPTPSPSASSLPGVTPLWPQGAVSVAGLPNDEPWLLRDHPGGDFYVAQVGPDGPGEGFIVPAPATYVAPGQNVEWVVGSSGGTGRVSVVDNATGHVSTMTFDGAITSSPVVVGDALYAIVTNGAGVAVSRFSLSGDGIDQSKSLSIDGATEIALTAKQHPWVLAGTKLIEVVTSANSLSTGSTVDWSADIYGPAEPGDSLWAYDGDRLIGLTPKYLTGCVSCAEGYRLTLDARPAAVANSADGGLFAAIFYPSAVGAAAGPNDGIYDYLAQDVRGAGRVTGPRLFGVRAVALAADPNGGVDYVDDQGALNRWDPAAAASR
jgi:hypothetical protein